MVTKRGNKFYEGWVSGYFEMREDPKAGMLARNALSKLALGETILVADDALIPLLGPLAVLPIFDDFAVPPTALGIAAAFIYTAGYVHFKHYR